MGDEMGTKGRPLRGALGAHLLVRRDPLLVLDLRFHILDRVAALDLQCDGLARQGLWRAQRPMNNDIGPAKRHAATRMRTAGAREGRGGAAPSPSGAAGGWPERPRGGAP